MRVAVIGATGNVGTSVVSALGRDDGVEEIIGVARRAPGWTAPETTWTAADIRLRLQPISSGWLDMGLASPVMDTTRARDELGFAPRQSSGEALLELLDGMRGGVGGPTPPLEPGAGGPPRIREVLTGVGGRAP